MNKEIVQRNIESFPETKLLYRELYNIFLKHIPHKDYCIAGGFVRYCLERDKKEQGWDWKPPIVPGDVDIYLYNKERVEDTIKSLYPIVRDASYANKWPNYNRLYEKPIHNTPFSYTFKYSPLVVDKMRIPIQIIKFWFGQPADIIKSFDFTCVAAAVDNNYVYCSDQALDDIWNKRLRYNKVYEGFSYNKKAMMVRRLDKYCYKDFMIVDSDIVVDLLSDELTLDNEYNDLWFYNKESLAAVEVGSADNIYSHIEKKLRLPLRTMNIDNSVKAEMVKRAMDIIDNPSRIRFGRYRGFLKNYKKIQQYLPLGRKK